ncbi:MAG: sensor histidine kinase [Bacteroidota bacterium]
MKIHIFIGLFLIAAGLNGFATDRGNPIPERGVLDLTSTGFGNSQYNLNGEWEFYWEELLTPDNYKAKKEAGSGIFVNVPSYWNGYEVNGERLPGQGYGTYAMTILLSHEAHSPLCFDIPVFDVAYKFFINDRLVGENGSVGTTQDEEAPWYETGYFCYIPERDTLQLLIQVSNFHHRRGGFWQSVTAGDARKILLRTERRKMYNFSTIGVLFFFTLFFGFLWYFSRRDLKMLLFALTTLGILIRSVNTGLHFSNFFVDTPWAWQIRMEYFGTYLAHLSGMYFLHHVFPRRYMNRVITANAVVSSLLIISLFVMPPRIFAYGMFIFQPLIMLFLIHYLVVSFAGIFRRKVIDTIFFASLGLFTYTMVNDIMVANSVGSVSNDYISQLSFQAFIFAMAILIIMQWVANYNTRFDLEASLRFKNRVLSVIAHDLKNPVASIAQFADLLVAKPELAVKKQVLNSLQESSQAAVDLLDNLLLWGRSQADELSTEPVNFDIGRLITETESLFSHMAAQKEVTLRSDVYKGTTVYADRALINIVIRNLVSNAIKFTPGKGIVTIHAQPEASVVRISVSDTGVGINPDILDQFRSGGQIESSMGTDKEIGTGLGLQLVSDLVKKNEGVLKIDSTTGKGSTFTFTLPGGDKREIE